mgnify:FL=1
MALHAYSLWIFDRHCDVIYHQDWSHLHQRLNATASSASSLTSSLSSTLQLVGGGSSEADKTGPHTAPKRARGETMDGVTRSVNAANDDAAIDPRLLPFDEEAKLIYGLVYSLRNLARKLGGSQETFHNISTATYTLTHMQTPSMYTFVLITDPPPRVSDKSAFFGTPGTTTIPGTNGMNLRGVLRELWRGPWVQFGAHHPLVGATERDAFGVQTPSSSSTSSHIQRKRGIDNDALRKSIERCTYCILYFLLAVFRTKLTISLVLAQYKLLPTL